MHTPSTDTRHLASEWLPMNFPLIYLQNAHSYGYGPARQIDKDEDDEIEIIKTESKYKFVLIVRVFLPYDNSCAHTAYARIICDK